MDSAVASLLGLIVTGIALYGFYWVIRLAVRDGMIDAQTRREDQHPKVPVQPGASTSEPAA